MKMIARVRMIEEVEFDHDVPDHEYDDHPRARTSSPGQVSDNEVDVLAARAEAAVKAEQAARERYPDALEILVEEVRDA